MKAVIFKSVFISAVLIFSGAVVYGCRPAQKQISADHEIYQCAMHPNITSDKPGDCPICHMRLTKVEHHTENKKGKILFYRHPMRPEVSSPVPAKDEMGMDYIPVYEEAETGDETVIAGRAAVSVSPERQQQIGVKISEVKKMPLEMKVRELGRVAYNTDLHNIIGEYREAVDDYIRFNGSPYAEIRKRAAANMNLADLKLRLSGISARQMKEMKDIGQSSLRLLTYTHSAEDLFLPEGFKWVYVDLFENESDLASPNQKVTAKASALPGKIFEGTVRTVDLIPNAAIRTVRVRIETADPQDLLREGMPVDVTLHVTLGEKLAVPEEAVLSTGERTLVFVAEGEGRFEPREVRVGYEAGGFQEVVEGLAEGERVISSANFLIDSESRIRAALQSFGKEHVHD